MAKRGRPTKSGVSQSQPEIGFVDEPAPTPTPGPEAEAQKSGESPASFSVKEVKTLTEEQKRAKRESAKRWRDKKRAEEAGVSLPDNPDVLSAAAFLTITDSLVIGWAGNDAAMMQHERAMIEGPLLRMLARMDDQTRDAVNKWADPVMLFSGLAMYFGRALAIKRDNRETQQEVQTGVAYQPERQPEATPEQKPLFEFQPPAETSNNDLSASPSTDILQMVGGMNGITRLP